MGQICTLHSATMTASSGSSDQVTLMVDIHVAPENVDNFLEGLKISYDGVAAEPECIFYDLFVDKDDPGHLRIVEVWNASHDWMQNVRQLRKCQTCQALTSLRFSLRSPTTVPIWRRLRLCGRLRVSHSGRAVTASALTFNRANSLLCTSARVRVSQAGVRLVINGS